MVNHEEQSPSGTLLGLAPRWWVVISGVLMLVLVNLSILQRENLIRDGRIVLLELAPVDPRSLMQGDYMALRYQMEAQAFPHAKLRESEDGFVIAQLDEHGVARFQRRQSDLSQLAQAEVGLRYRVRHHRPQFASPSYFFQEGKAAHFEKARYGEYRVAENGDMILTGLRDEKFQKL